jgi:hypothetical protein
VTASGVVHLVLAFIAFVCVTIGTIVVSVSLRADPASQPVRDVLLGVDNGGRHPRRHHARPRRGRPVTSAPRWVWPQKDLGNSVLSGRKGVIFGA